MNAQKIIAAALFAAVGSAFAADAPASDASAAAATVTAASLDLPSININRSVKRTRDEVYAEAVEFVKNHKTAFAIQLEQYKN